jgi:hypothetical protein
MKRYIVALYLFFLIPFSFGQTLKIQTGISISKLFFDNSLTKESDFNNKVNSFTGLIGVEYLNFKYFNLSSNIGYNKKGGKEVFEVIDPEGNSLGNKEVIIRLDYLTLNTTINFKLPIKNKLFPFIEIGPRIDYLFSYSDDVNFIKGFEDNDKLNKVIYGAIVGGGLKYSLHRFQIGLVAEYYLNFNKMADYSALDINIELYDRTYTLNLLLGYKLK